MHLGSLSPMVSGSCGKDPLLPTLTWRRFQMLSRKGIKNRSYSTDTYQCKEIFLDYGGNKEFVIKGYVDAIFDVDSEDFESQSGYILKVGEIS